MKRLLPTKKAGARRLPLGPMMRAAMDSSLASFGFRRLTVLPLAETISSALRASRMASARPMVFFLASTRVATATLLFARYSCVLPQVVQPWRW
jgi:hypothetical protein